MPKNLLSILTPTYNRARSFLLQTIESVQKQQENGFNHEHIIVDNASSDDTEAIVKKYMKNDLRIKYLRNHRNEGPATALNKAFALSRGQLILPLDDDDLLPFQSLQMHFECMQNHRAAGWSYGYALNITETNQLMGLSERIPFFSQNSRELFDSILDCNTITNGAVILRREVVETMKGWDSNVKAQDWDMWLKLSFNNIPAQLNKNYLLLYRVHPAQLTTFHSKDGTWQKDREYFQKIYSMNPA